MATVHSMILNYILYKIFTTLYKTITYLCIALGSDITKRASINLDHNPLGKRH